MIRRPELIQIASPSVLLSSPRRERMKRMTTSSAATTRVWSRRVIPPPGAVWPAMVIWPLAIFSWRFSGIVPATSNTTVRGPSASTAARRDPGPESSRLVTLITAPPRPPVANRPAPSAPGKARTSRGAALAAAPRARVAARVGGADEHVFPPSLAGYPGVHQDRYLEGHHPSSQNRCPPVSSQYGKAWRRAVDDNAVEH
jgi:hypothetical protein